MSADTNQDRFEELRNELVSQLQRAEEVAHKLSDDMTAIGGYTEILVMRAGPEQTFHELKKILDRAKRSLLVLQSCISDLRLARRRFSQ